PFGLGLAALDGSGAGPSHRGPSERSLAIEIVPDALAGFLHGPRLRRPDVDGYAEIHIGFAGVTRLEPGLAVCPETCPQLGDIHNAQPDEDGYSHLADLDVGLLVGGGHPDVRSGDMLRAPRHRRVFAAVIV